MTVEQMTPEARRLRGQLGGLVTASRGAHVTEPGRRAADQRFIDQVIAYAASKGETLTEAETARRAAAARKAFYVRLSFYSARARRQKAEARRLGPYAKRAAPVTEEDPGRLMEVADAVGRPPRRA